MGGKSDSSISVLILARNEAANLQTLLPEIRDVLVRSGRKFEIVVIDGQSQDGTARVAELHGARVLSQRHPGYANALRQGIATCAGDFVVALDADYSHRPDFVESLLLASADADIVVASRYVAGGSADMSVDRRALSVIINRVFGFLLRVPIRDMTSGFRVYRRAALQSLEPRGEHFDALPELLALAHFAGRLIREIPFHYHPREAGLSKANALKFAPAYLRTLLRCWRMKKSRRENG
ncbi:MAG: glycosyltransferase [Dokdonella sp.]